MSDRTLNGKLINTNELKVWPNAPIDEWTAASRPVTSYGCVMFGMRGLIFIGFLASFGLAACGGGGGSAVPGPPVAAQSAPPNDTSGAGSAGAAAAASAVPLSPNATSVELGGVAGTTVVAQRHGAPWPLGEDVALLFPVPISPASYNVTVSPAPPGGVMIVNPAQADTPAASVRNLLQLRWNKIPGTTYTVSATGSSGSAGPFSVTMPAAAPTPQPPLLSKRSDPYYYGSLEHSGTPPWGLKLPDSGNIDPASLHALTEEGVHFIRFGPAPDEVAYNATGAQSRQSYSFASTDPVLVSLHAANITALYVIDAAGAPPWANANAAGDARPLFETPALYAEYCSGVATHIAATLPWVTRVEIGTNEPNYASNWQNDQAVADGMPQYNDATGYAFALYASACYSAIKAVAPNLQVVAPGITIGSNAYNAFAFIDHLYAAGCRVGVCWDILSVHSYTWVDPGYGNDQSFMDNLLGAGAGPGTFLSYRALQARAVQDGELATPPIMITEMGFSDYAADPRSVDPNVQAYYTSEAFNGYLADPTVRGIVYADILNHETVPSIFSGIAAISNGVMQPVGAVYRTFATF